MSQEWQEATRLVLAAVDVRAEFAALGVRFASDTPNARGWLNCHAVGRADDHPSAGVNVGDGPLRGRYRDFGGGGLSLSFFEFAAAYGPHSDWRAARKFYAERHHVPLPRGREPARPRDRFNRLGWDDAIARSYCEAKKPITVYGLRACAAFLCHYPRGAAAPRVAFAVPLFGPALLDGEPVGYVLFAADGGTLPLYRGKDRPPDQKKTLVFLEQLGVGAFAGALGLSILADARAVWKVEGVTDLLALQSLVPPDQRKRIAVVTNANGATENPASWFVPMLAQKHVCVVGDADTPGQTGAARWCSQLVGATSSVRNVVLPYEISPNHGSDLRDYLNQHSYPELLALARRTPPLEPSPVGAPATNREQEILSCLGLDVLGERADGSIEVFSSRLRKISTVSSVGRLSYAELLQLAGEPARDLVHEGREPQPDRFTLSEVRNAVALEGGRFRLSSSPPLGAGCWRLEPGLHVLVDGNHAAVWDGRSLEIVSSPRVGGRLLDFGQEPWCDFDRLRSFLVRRDPSSLAAVADFLRNWNWKHPSDPELAASLVLCTWVQTFWNWRPLVATTGSSNAGKSTLFEYVASLFGHLALSTNKPTEAAVRQHVANRACPLLLDEFENDFNRARVLDLLRSSSKGGHVIRGSSDQRGTRFGLRHVVWIAAVESGLRREPDRNRFIQLDLDRLRVGTHGKIKLPHPADAFQLGLRTLALSLQCVEEAIPLADRLKTTEVPGVAGRVVESFSVPAAMYAVASGLDPDAVLARFLAGRASAEGGSFDEEDLLRDILEAQIDAGPGKHYSVAEILSSSALYNDAHDALERCGVALVRHKTGPRTDAERADGVFFNPSAVHRFLLRGTRWFEGVDLDQLLLRLRGAARAQRTVAGKRVRGVEVPPDALHLPDPAADTFLPESTEEEDL